MLSLAMRTLRSFLLGRKVSGVSDGESPGPVLLKPAYQGPLPRDGDVVVELPSGLGNQKAESSPPSLHILQKQIGV